MYDMQNVRPHMSIDVSGVELMLINFSSARTLPNSDAKSAC